MNLLNFRRFAILLTLVWLGLFVPGSARIGVIDQCDVAGCATFGGVAADLEFVGTAIRASVCRGILAQFVAVGTDHADLLGVGVSVCVFVGEIADGVARGVAVFDDCAILDE